LSVIAIALAVVLAGGILPGFAAAEDEHGNPVPLDVAKQVAVNHLNSFNSMLANRVLAKTSEAAGGSEAATEASMTEIFTETVGEKNIYYVINLAPEGWVIVSADYVAYPIIAYSDEGSYSEENHPPAFDAWMENVKAEISSAIENDLSPLEEARDAWDRLNAPAAGFLAKAPAAVSAASSVSPLLTTTWGQGGKEHFGSILSTPWYPKYDYYCPREEKGSVLKRFRVSPTGCVATAAGQVMRYWQWPEHGEGWHSWDPPYVPTETDGEGCAGYGACGVNFASAHYHWSEMPNEITSTLFGDIDDNEKEIARVLRQIGVALDMDYTPSGSAAYLSDVASALPRYFRYQWSAYYGSRIWMSSSQWVDLLKAELSAGRPLVYGGTGPAGGGHAFVCDGYNASDQFHFNWGWDGDYNGYYSLNDLTPGSDDYTSGQAAVFDLKPDYPPQAHNDAYDVNEDNTLNAGAPGLLGNDSDHWGQQIWAYKDTDPTYGTLNLNSNGSFTYTPNANFHGTDSFTYHAGDGRYNSNVATVTITVYSVDDPPILNHVGDRSVDEGQTLTFDVTASDVDSPASTLTLSAANLPEGAAFIDNGCGSGAFSWTPTEAQGPGSYNTTFTATGDGEPALSDSETITITVNEVNQAPELDPVGDQSIDEGQTLTFNVTASDADIPANTLTFSSPDLPDGATLDPVSGEFRWRPDYNAYDNSRLGDGAYSMNVTVSDDGCPSLNDTALVAIDVENEPYGATQNVTASEGGTAANDAGTAEVEIPAGAIDEDTEINIEPHSRYVLQDVYGEIIGLQYNFSPSGMTFNEPVTIRLYYDPAVVLEPWLLDIYYYNETMALWEPMHATLHLANHCLYIPVDHFSTFATVGIPAPVDIDAYIQSLADDAFNKNAKQRRNALGNKLTVLFDLDDNGASMKKGDIKSAINKLLNDIRPKMDGEGDDWIVDSTAQQELCAMIDTLVNHLRAKL